MDRAAVGPVGPAAPADGVPDPEAEASRAAAEAVPAPGSSEAAVRTTVPDSLRR